MFEQKSTFLSWGPRLLCTAVTFLGAFRVVSFSMQADLTDGQNDELDLSGRTSQNRRGHPDTHWGGVRVEASTLPLNLPVI